MSIDEPDEIAQAVGDAERASSEGDHARAEHALRRALWLQEARFGLVHPEVANTLNNLGVVCDTLGRPNEAEFLYRRALGLARTTLPAGHPYIETSLQNLKALYRTQGRPEKLALVADSETSRSGLPLQAAGDGDEQVDAPVPEELSGAPTAAPAPSAGSEPTSPPEVRSDTLYDQLAQHAVLMVAAVSILLFVGWWLFAGNGGEESSAPADPPVVTRAPEPPVSTESPGSPESPVSPESDTAVEPAEPEDRASPIPESPSDEPPAASADEAGVASAVVVEARVCGRLVTRDDDGSLLGDWRCDPVGGTVDAGPLYFYTRIRSPTGITVEHRWLREGVVQQVIDLEVGANDGRGYRTYSTLTVSPERGGAWQVEVRTGDDEVLQVEDFVVRLP